MMKKSAMLVASLLVFGMTQGAIAGPKKLKKFDDMADSLTNGNVVRVLIDMNKCVASTSIPQDKVNPVGGMTLDKFVKYDTVVDGKSVTVIAAGDSMLVNSSKFGLVQNRLSLHFMETGNVEFVSELIDPRTYASLGVNTYNCSFSEKGKNAVSVYELT